MQIIPVFNHYYVNSNGFVCVSNTDSDKIRIFSTFCVLFRKEILKITHFAVDINGNRIESDREALINIE